ncbi:MAG: deoxyribodipyrimidine photo-lyase, partial [Myxococcales bacterium]|nr:deoxyribodipyrimidine photo-lyase [Myxococcales bacterium]
MSKPCLFWFRRDLRLADNPALTAASERGPVLPVFVIDDALWKPAGDNRRAFLIASLADLRASTRGALEVTAGAPEAALLERARSVGAEVVIATEDFGPYGRARDLRVAASLEGAGIELRLIDSPYA